MTNRKHFTASLCLTHQCNLNCIYCFQTHDKEHVMSLDTAKSCIDYLFDVRLVNDTDIEVELSLIGGEPLLRFELIQGLFEYMHTKSVKNRWVFFISTNGTVLNDRMKDWLAKRKDRICLGLSLDGTRETQNRNRSNSFDAIDFKFFKDNWPEQNVKMTLSEHSILNFSENVKFIHSLGFGINGADLAEGAFDWSDDKFVQMLIPQLKELMQYYSVHTDIKSNRLFAKDLAACAMKHRPRTKYCGIGDNLVFFDTDGEKYPCSFVTPMTFSPEDIRILSKIDFSNDEAFIDEECFNQCYIYPICNTCAGANFLIHKELKKRDKRKCKIRKLVALFVAILQSKLIIKNPQLYEPTKLYYTIEAIKEIKKLYLKEFEIVS